MKHIKKLAAKLSLALLFLFVFQTKVFLSPPVIVDGQGLSSAKATLGNSRLSFRTEVSGTPSAGDASVTIETSNQPDTNTNHLFPNDTVCFPDEGENGCSDQTTYTVTNIVDTDTFAFTPVLAGALADTDLVISTQSGSLEFEFTTTTEIPTTGDIYITIPAVDADNKTCDGIPDTGASTSVNGFDLNTIASTDITVSSSGCDNNWTTQNPTCGGAASDHTIRIDRNTNSCAAGSTITVTIDNDPGVINPASLTTGDTGVADVYTINMKTRGGSDETLDNVDVKVAVVEAVLVSATIDETLSFEVDGVDSSETNCGSNAETDVTTYAYSVPFGTISSSDTFYDAQQQLTVSTNASGGYEVRFYEDDELGLDGADSPYIPDTPGDTPLATHTTADEWVTASTNGFGYSLQGTDTKFEWDDNTPTTGFSAKQLPNYTEGSTQHTDTDAEIMSNSGPVSASSAFVCYRLSVSGTQEAGYYYNKVTYIATATF
jgi:hypothetical protein